VAVATRGRRVRAIAARLGGRARRLLVLLRRPDAELSVLLVSDPVMHRLNLEWRGVDRPTDVLAFAQAEGPGGAPVGLLGDVVISVDTARRQAAERHAPVGAELDRLLIHGVLHLLGHDHHRRRDAERMAALEARLLGRPGMVPPR
jgi:probable rRNA maturation factor